MSSPSQPVTAVDAVADNSGLLRQLEGQENFPVALRLLPRRLRADLRAVYDIARTIDDLGDEAPGDRLALLDGFEADLRRAWTSTEPQLPVVQRLVPVVRGHDLSIDPFLRLVAANRLDQRQSSYPTWNDLLHYCTLSADPIGRIVLAVTDSVTSRPGRAVRPGVHRAAGSRALPGRRRGPAARPDLPADGGPRGVRRHRSRPRRGPHDSRGASGWWPTRSSARASCWRPARSLVRSLRGAARLAVAGYRGRWAGHRQMRCGEPTTTSSRATSSRASATSPATRSGCWQAGHDVVRRRGLRACEATTKHAGPQLPLRHPAAAARRSARRCARSTRSLAGSTTSATATCR